MKEKYTYSFKFSFVSLMLLLCSCYVSSCKSEGHCNCTKGTSDTDFIVGSNVSTSDGNKKCKNLQDQYHEDTCVFYIPQKK